MWASLNVLLFVCTLPQAFGVLFRNIVRVAVINLVGGFILFVMKLMVVGGTAVAAYIWLAVSWQCDHTAHWQTAGLVDAAFGFVTGRRRIIVLLCDGCIILT